MRTPFDKFFDFNQDGEMSPAEEAAATGYMINAINESQKSYNENFNILSDDNAGIDLFGDSTDDDISPDLEFELSCIGVDKEEFKAMDDFDKEQVFADAGLDPDDFDF